MGAATQLGEITAANDGSSDPVEGQQTVSSAA